jgi:hypothetical protein
MISIHLEHVRFQYISNMFEMHMIHHTSEAVAAEAIAAAVAALESCLDQKSVSPPEN